MTMSMVELVTELRRYGLLDPSRKRGCTAQEIRALELKYDVRLPDAYRAFLAEFGRGGAEVLDFKELDFLYPHVMDITAYVHDYRTRIEERLAALCAREGAEPGPGDRLSALPEHSLFIANRSGVTFLFIVAVGGADCPVHYYSTDTDDGMDELQEAFPSVRDWLLSSVRGTGELRRRIR